eukprot:UN01403
MIKEKSKKRHIIKTTISITIKEICCYCYHCCCCCWIVVVLLYSENGRWWGREGGWGFSLKTK